MKKILLLATLLPLAVFAQKDVTKENYDPFFTKKEAPHIENVLPAPPTLTDPRFFDDWAQYQWGKSIRDTERGKLAVEDAGIYAGYFMKRFSPAMEGTLTPETHPILYRLLSRAHRTEQQAGASAKAYFKRVRPYQQYKEPSGVPSHESPTDFTSYPSGHTHASWLVGMILTVLDPAHTEEIMKVAYELGQSRVIVGFHYQSDVDAGRVIGSITFARLCSEPEFQSLLKKAVKEYKKNLKK
jgi:acid phosphatase (class A)